MGNENSHCDDCPAHLLICLLMGQQFIEPYPMFRWKQPAQRRKDHTHSAPLGSRHNTTNSISGICMCTNRTCSRSYHEHYNRDERVQGDHRCIAHLLWWSRRGPEFWMPPFLTMLFCALIIIPCFSYICLREICTAYLGVSFEPMCIHIDLIKFLTFLVLVKLITSWCYGNQLLPPFLNIWLLGQAKFVIF